MKRPQRQTTNNRGHSRKTTSTTTHIHTTKQIPMPSGLFPPLRMRSLHKTPMHPNSIAYVYSPIFFFNLANTAGCSFRSPIHQIWQVTSTKKKKHTYTHITHTPEDKPIRKRKKEQQRTRTAVLSQPSSGPNECDYCKSGDRSHSPTASVIEDQPKKTSRAVVLDGGKARWESTYVAQTVHT